MNRKLYLWLAACWAVWLLVACGNGQTPPTAVSQAATTTLPAHTATTAPTDTAVTTNTPVPSEMPAPTNTATATPTITHTPEPIATTTGTASPEPTATHTATSSPSPAPIAQPTTAVATPTASAPISAPVAPPAAPLPSGPNLLVNPGFEDGRTGWVIGGIQGTPGKPQFVHSGEYSAFNVGYQLVTDNIVPGTTYRAGAWVRIWSSSGEDRAISENPGDLAARICINTNGDDVHNLPTSVCSGWARPIDTWQYISVDAVALSDRLTVILAAAIIGPNRPKHNEAYWDDTALGQAPVAATVTPAPVAVVRPSPVPFQAADLRDNMNYVRSQIEQMGGVLDRLYNGEPGRCSEYQEYYNNLIRSATYDGIPADWQGIYNDYIFAVENTLATNEGLNSLCNAGSGSVTQQNYGLGRQGINTSLERLAPAIDAANTLLGG